MKYYLIPFCFSFFALFVSNSLAAQERIEREEYIPPKHNWLFSETGVGVGSAVVSRAFNQPIAKNGYTAYSGMFHFNANFGVNFKNGLSVYTGFNQQFTNIRFNLNGDDYMYDGSRSLLPLGFRAKVDFEYIPFQLFTDFGGYYAFSTNDRVIGQSVQYRLNNPTSNFGIFFNLGGIIYSRNNDVGISFSVNAFGDVSGDNARLFTIFTSIGIVVGI
jgi:hypothetical protein